MNFWEKRGFIRDNGRFYLFTALFFFGIKLFYSRASSDQLLWILAPTTRWVELLSGISFVYQWGTGYVNHHLRCLIAPSCAGINFMVIAAAMLVFSFVHRLEGGFRGGLKVLWVTGSMLFSFLITIFVNGLRIILAIYLPDFIPERMLFGKPLTWEELHTVIGTAVYFVSLLMIYRWGDYVSLKLASGKPSENSRFGQRFGRSLSGKPSKKALFGNRTFIPLFWYFLITIGLPFLNRAYRKDHVQFTEFSLLIGAVCSVIVGMQMLISLLLRRRRGR